MLDGVGALHRRSAISNAAHVTPSEWKGWLRGLFATEERRQALLYVAVGTSLVSQALNLTGVFDGAPVVVYVVMAMVYGVLLTLLVALLVIRLRERRARRNR